MQETNLNRVWIRWLDVIVNGSITDAVRLLQNAIHSLESGSSINATNRLMVMFWCGGKTRLGFR